VNAVSACIELQFGGNVLKKAGQLWNYTTLSKPYVYRLAS